MKKQHSNETKINELELFDKTELLEIERILTIILCTYAKLNCLKENWLFE